MRLEALLKKPNNKILLIVFITTVTLTFIFLSIIFPLILAQFPEGSGLLAIKNAWNKENMDKVIAIWNNYPSQDYLGLMVVVHMWDLLFMAVYGTALFSGLLVVARLLNSSEKLQRIYLCLGVLLAPASVILDLIEEYHILAMLSDPSNIIDLNAFGASLATIICIWLVYGGLFLVFIGLIIGGILTIKTRK
jgi:hypothetical protein